MDMATRQDEVEQNPFLKGNFAPTPTEDDFELEIVGELPGELTGALYRIGPNPHFTPRDANHHWFIGDGMIHSFHVQDGRARYLNRWVRTPKWEAENAAGRALFGSFGNPMTTDPSVMGQDSGVANTNIVMHGGELLALEEGHRPFVVDPRTLAARGYREFPKGGPDRFTAHPKTDPKTGDLTFFGYGVGPMPLSDQVSYGVLDAAGVLKRHDVFTAPYASMVHDFMVTDRHVLLPILPLTASLERAMGGGPAFAWEPDKPAYVGVMARDAGVETIRWFSTEANYVFHVMNAWEGSGEGGRTIHADVMQYETAPLFPLANGSSGGPAIARLCRWSFDLDGGTDTIKRSYIDDMAGEFPRIDDRRAGLGYRHGWFAGMSADRPGFKSDTLAHIDHATGRRTVHRLPAGDVTSEPVFVPRSAEAAEGDGFILSTIYRAAEDRSDMAVFDAQDLAAGPLALAKLPRRVPFGFHGTWVDAAAMG